MISLHIEGGDSILKRISEMETGIPQKQKILLEKLAEIGVDIAQVRFRNAEYDGDNDVVVNAPTWVSDNVIQVIASGTSVTFIEFGAGVYQPGYPGELPDGIVGRGQYGRGLGKLKKWRYPASHGAGTHGVYDPDHPGEIITEGNPPARAMYDAGKEMRSKIREVVKEVYA